MCVYVCVRERNGVERKQENRMVCACMYTCVREEVSKKRKQKKEKNKVNSDQGKQS